MHRWTATSGLDLLNDFRRREGLPAFEGNVFDLHVEKSRAIFQIGTPGLDFPRTDWPANFQFIGALLPERRAGNLPAALHEKLERFPTLVVVSQGTTDNRDANKLFVPALEALAGSTHLIAVATGGRHTEQLRRRFPHDNAVIEDWIDFHELLPHADLFLTNGGFGSVLLALSNGVPVLSAGKLEGKADINARLDYHGVGFDLRTERPTPARIKKGTARVLGDSRYARRVAEVRAELGRYRPLEIIEHKLAEDGVVPCPTKHGESPAAG
jgi:UDP:flavonoid glycosyltransferase YjiC (YdhE family)